MPSSVDLEKDFRKGSQFQKTCSLGDVRQQKALPMLRCKTINPDTSGDHVQISTLVATYNYLELCKKTDYGKHICQSAMR